MWSTPEEKQKNKHVCVLLCSIDPRVGKIRNVACSQVALGSSPELSACTMLIAPPFPLSPIFLTDTEVLQDPMQFQRAHAQGQFDILREVL